MSSALPLDGGTHGSLAPTPWTVTATLRGRRTAARRRRLVLRLRDWLGITVIACFSMTLFAVALFSLLGR
jgi:hypothetical protein